MKAAKMPLLFGVSDLGAVRFLFWHSSFSIGQHRNPFYVVRNSGTKGKMVFEWSVDLVSGT